MDPSLVALLGTPWPVGVDNVWPVAIYDERLACTYMAEVRHSPGEVQACCQVVDDAPRGLPLESTIEHVLVEGFMSAA